VKQCIGGSTNQCGCGAFIIFRWSAHESDSCIVKKYEDTHTGHPRLRAENASSFAYALDPQLAQTLVEKFQGLGENPGHTHAQKLAATWAKKLVHPDAVDNLLRKACRGRVTARENIIIGLLDDDSIFSENELRVMPGACDATKLLVALRQITLEKVGFKWIVELGRIPPMFTSGKCM
jgi:hypothetical protein